MDIYKRRNLRKVILMEHVSVDGFVAGANDELDLYIDEDMLDNAL